MRYTRKMVEHLLAIVNAEYKERNPEYDNPYYPDGPYHIDQAYGGTTVVFSKNGSGCSDLMCHYGTMREAYLFARGLYHGYFVY